MSSPFGARRKAKVIRQYEEEDGGRTDSTDGETIDQGKNSTPRQYSAMSNSWDERR